MCKVDRKTIDLVNKQMIARYNKGKISIGDAKDNQIIVPINLLGVHQYRMSLDRVNEIYGRARKKAIKNHLYG